MCAHFSHMPVFQDEDLVTVIDGAQTMRDKHARPRLFFNDAVDILALSKRLNTLDSFPNIEDWSYFIHFFKEAKQSKK